MVGHFKKWNASSIPLNTLKISEQSVCVMFFVFSSRRVNSAKTKIVVNCQMLYDCSLEEYHTPMLFGLKRGWFRGVREEDPHVFLKFLDH